MISVSKKPENPSCLHNRTFGSNILIYQSKFYPIKGLDIAVLIVSIALIAIGFLF